MLASWPAKTIVRMRKRLRKGALVLLAMTAFAPLATAEQDKVILASVRESGTDWLSVTLLENPRGARSLRVRLPGGRNVGGETPARTRIEDVSVQAFDDAGTPFDLKPFIASGTIPGVCNAGSCDAILDLQLSASNSASDRLRRVIVVFNGKRAELTMATPLPAGGKR